MELYRYVNIHNTRALEAEVAVLSNGMLKEVRLGKTSGSGNLFQSFDEWVSYLNKYGMRGVIKPLPLIPKDDVSIDIHGHIQVVIQ